MKKSIILIAFFLTSAFVFAGSKPLVGKHKIVAKVAFVEGDYVLIVGGNKKQLIVPSELPLEFEKEGMEIVAEGDMGKCINKRIAMQVHALAVSKETYKELGLKNIEYNYQLYAVAASAF